MKTFGYDALDEAIAWAKGPEGRASEASAPGPVAARRSRGA